MSKQHTIFEFKDDYYPFSIDIDSQQLILSDACEMLIYIIKEIIEMSNDEYCDYIQELGTINEVEYKYDYCKFIQILKKQIGFKMCEAEDGFIKPFVQRGLTVEKLNEALSFDCMIKCI